LFIELRAAFRLTRVGLHLLWAIATVAVVFPWASPALRRVLKRRWSRQLVGILGIKVGAGKTAPIPSGLLVCNHISWLDIYVINALAPAAFVSKDDVKDWPLIGWLCKHTETIFLERGSRAAAQRTRETMVAQLASGTHVALFPEGTTTAGDRLLPFHGALFQSAIDARVPVVPLALRYIDADGNPSRAPAYDGDITLLQCMRAIARASGLSVQVRVLAPLDTANVDRRHLAAHCHHAIAWHLGHANPSATPSQTDAPTDHRASEISAGPQVALP
jgi:1-acyl-sn-glycerol-3-phosphate acyltransferase